MSCATSALRPSGKRSYGALRAAGTVAGSLRRTWPSTQTPVTGSPLGQARAWWRPRRRGSFLVGCWATKTGACPVPCVSREALPGEILGLVLGVPRQQVAPGCVAEGARDRVGTLLQLKARGWWKEPAPRGRSRAPLIPRIPVERGVLGLFPPVPDGTEPVAHRENAVGRTFVSSGANALPSSGILSNCRRHAT